MTPDLDLEVLEPGEISNAGIMDRMRAPDGVLIYAQVISLIEVDAPSRYSRSANLNTDTIRI